MLILAEFSTKITHFFFIRLGYCTNFLFKLPFSIQTSTIPLLATVIGNSMKKKIILKVQMKCEKCRTEALKVAAKACGVNFVGLEGDNKEKVVVIGDGVDPVDLAIDMRKKVGPTDIISVADAT
ncbi:disease resistance protein Piks-1 [Hevea brasiliensis]|uniref:disease resistance protein Piks-1 n=1 Tax=Hevea brasiliensis TaxID=3981 RepID=UPI0025F6BB43|nr:disease resistance protein Piks-1 [Hevea brasiliensis]